MKQCIGLDLGYGFVKVTDGREGFLFPSVVGDGLPGAPLRLGLQTPEPTDDLRLTVDGRPHYVGNLAIKRSRLAFRSLSENRAEGNESKVLFLAGLSLFCKHEHNTFAVVTGLPPGRMHRTAELVERLKGEHRVIRHGLQDDEELVIRVENLSVVPQPLGSYWVQVLDQMGQLRPDARMVTGRFGVVDVGFHTSDLVVIQDGEYVPEASRTIPNGLATAYSEIAARLQATYGIERETYALDDCVLTGQLSIAGQRMDINDLVEQAFANVATKLLVEIRSTWQLTELDQILLTGGGGDALSKYLLPHLKQARVVTDAATANSRGYLVWANRLLSA